MQRYKNIQIIFLIAILALVAPTVSAVGDPGRLTVIKSRARAEITRRLNSLNRLNSAINGTSRLSDSAKSTLSGEVNAEISDLTRLKSKIAADTDLATARIDAQAIFTEYRIYALVVPKVWLVRTVDDQQAVEDKLNTMIGKLQTRINTAQGQGKDTASLQAALNDMTAQVHAAQIIALKTGAAILRVQPTDYNNDHSVLGGYVDQVQQAHRYNQAAYANLKIIVQGLKTL